MVGGLLLQALGLFLQFQAVVGLGTAENIAVSYGAKGQSVCSIHDDANNFVTCYGSDQASVYSAPPRISMTQLTGGDGFVCGLAEVDRTPYCWGNNIYVPAGIPTLPDTNRTYVGISAGDNHLCALRAENTVAKRKNGISSSGSLGPWVDCWGYNMTGSYVNEPLVSITAGSFFTCGLYADNRTAVCWGDDNGYGVITAVPPLSFSSIAAGGYHVCGIVQEGINSFPGQTVCWGRTLESHQPNTSLSILVGGKFHSCGLRADSHSPVCWGLNAAIQVSSAANVSLLVMVAGDFFTCAIETGTSTTICWGSNYPLPPVVATSPGAQSPCRDGSSCSPASNNNAASRSSVQAPIIIGELVTAVVLICALILGAYFWVRYRLQRAASRKEKSHASSSDPSLHDHVQQPSKKTSFRLGMSKVKGGSARLDDSQNPRAHMYKYEELEEATGGFSKDNEIGQGSFSVVYRGIMHNGAVVAVKRAVGASGNPDKVPESKEFRNELDLLSRLNHAHLLNLLGFCEDGGERLLVYEYMVNGTLFEHLHGDLEEQLSWVTRLKIAVQAARGLEYLHGYAGHPVIHRDIKSCNILLDEEWNARVADFGLSLFGPENSNCPLSEPPAGTLGYLDPEYYRLHYLTTKSDVYSFGVLLLEIMSGRKAIDMAYSQGNIVEWAVPLIKAGLTAKILDNRIEEPHDLEALDRLAKVAAQCVKMRGKDRPSMEKVTTSLERALALMLGTAATDGQLILPTEVVLGSARLNKKTSSRRTSSSQKSGTDSRKSDSELGEPIKERDDFVDAPALVATRYPLRGGFEDHLPSRVQSLGRVQSFSKVNALSRNYLSRAYSFNKAYSHHTASSSRLDEDDLEMGSLGSPPFQTFNSLRPVDHGEATPRDNRVDSWGASNCHDPEISPESPRYFGRTEEGRIM